GHTDCVALSVSHLPFRSLLLIALSPPPPRPTLFPYTTLFRSLSLQQRRDLLTRFLNRADYVDVELRSASALHSLLSMAEQKKMRRIISFHDFKSTPLPRILCAKAQTAKAYGANIFKVATRTDTPIQLARLLDFITNRDADLAVSAMGIGQLGAISRVLLARAGSVLIYASVAEKSH